MLTDWMFCPYALTPQVYSWARLALFYDTQDQTLSVWARIWLISDAAWIRTDSIVQWKNHGQVKNAV